MPTIQHSLSDVITALNKKIDDLASAKKLVKETISSGKNVDKNVAVLEEIIGSLEAAENARNLLLDSCCTSQSCNFEYSDY